MSNLINKWVGYASRSYYDIKQDILNFYRFSIPEMTDFSESNMLVKLASIVAGVAETINYYIDNVARENSLADCRLFESVVKIAYQNGYMVKCNVPSYLVLAWTSSPTNPPLVMPAGTVFKARNPINGSEVFFQVANDTVLSFQAQVTLASGFTYVPIPLRQYISSTEEIDLEEVRSPYPSYRAFLAPEGFAYGTGVITSSNGQDYNWADTLDYTRFFADNRFTMSVDGEGRPILLISIAGESGEPERDPSTTFSLSNFGVTLGELGNGLFGAVIAVGDVPDLGISDGQFFQLRDPAVGGLTQESVIAIKENIGIRNKTQMRAVTAEDFSDLVRIFPAVRVSSVVRNSRAEIVLQVADASLLPLNSLLLDSIRGWFQDKILLGTKFVVRPYPVVTVVASVKIKLINDADNRGGASLLAVQNNIRNFFNFYEVKNNPQTLAGTPMFLLPYSDITAVIENTPNVRYSTNLELLVNTYFIDETSNTTAQSSTFRIEGSGVNNILNSVVVYAVTYRYLGTSLVEAFINEEFVGSFNPTISISPINFNLGGLQGTLFVGLTRAQFETFPLGAEIKGTFISLRSLEQNSSINAKAFIEPTVISLTSLNIELI